MSFEARVTRGSVAGIDERQWDEIESYFAKTSEGTDVLPRDLAIQAGLDFLHAKAVLYELERVHVAELRLYVYHCCSPEVPATQRLRKDGFQNLPWKCPHCEMIVTLRSELRYEPFARLLFVPTFDDDQ